MKDLNLSFFGRLALEKKMITPEQIQECVSIQLEYEGKGEKPPRLGELLVTNGYMTPEQVRQILTLQKERTEEEKTRQPKASLEVEYETGETIVEEGDANLDDLFVLLQGRVAAFIRGILLREYDEKGTFLGEIATLLGAPQPTTLVARTRCRCFRIPREGVGNFFRSRPAMAMRLAEVLAERMKDLLEDHAQYLRPANADGDGEPLLDLPGVGRLRQSEKGLELQADDTQPIRVNGQEIHGSAPLGDQSIIQVGPHSIQVFLGKPETPPTPMEKVAFPDEPAKIGRASCRERV
jgi:hypothetical protein